MSDAIVDVINERNRQVVVEGWTAKHDDTHTAGELALAGAVYAVGPALLPFWPWDLDWWKPKDRRTDLVRAAALIVAEIERLDRLEEDGEKA